MLDMKTTEVVAKAPTSHESRASEFWGIETGTGGGFILRDLRLNSIPLFNHNTCLSSALPSLLHAPLSRLPLENGDPTKICEEGIGTDRMAPRTVFFGTPHAPCCENTKMAAPVFLSADDNTHSASAAIVNMEASKKESAKITGNKKKGGAKKGSKALSNTSATEGNPMTPASVEDATAPTKSQNETEKELNSDINAKEVPEVETELPTQKKKAVSKKTRRGSNPNVAPRRSDRLAKRFKPADNVALVMVDATSSAK